MISPTDLLRLEAHARAHNGGMGDHFLLGAVRDARAGQSKAAMYHLEMMRCLSERVCVLVSDEAIATIPDDEIDALATAAWDSGRGNDRLVRLLRRIAPSDRVLVTLDARARGAGYVQAGSDEPIDTRDEVING